MNIRKALFAGSWYPANASECEREIKNFLKEAKTNHVSGKKRIGGIVPHAGWYFSGSIACNVIHLLSQDDSPDPDTVVIFGMHLHPSSPCYIMKEGAWETPFGELEIETRLTDELISLFDFQIETPVRFIKDNTIELQLPFIKYFFKNTKIVTIGVPPAKISPEIGKAVADISKNIGLKIKVIGSTDLTHYGVNYGFEPKGDGKEALGWVKNENDKKVIDAMLSMSPDAVIREGLSNHNACCSGAAATAIAAGKALGANQAELLTYATSYEKSPGNSFVGYAGIIF